MNIKDLQEQLQEDIISIMDGQNPQLIDAVCQVIVDQLNKLNQ